MTRSSLSSTKRKVDSPPPSNRLTIRPSTGARSVGDSPPAKWVKDNDDPPPPSPHQYNTNEWSLSSSEEGLKVERKGKGKVRASPPPDVDDSSYPTATIPTKKAVKPRLVASQLISVMGQLPQPLGKAATVSPYQTRLWYEEYPLDDPQFIKLWEQANLVPIAQHKTSCHVVIR